MDGILEYLDGMEACIEEWVEDGEGKGELLGFVDGLRRQLANNDADDPRSRPTNDIRHQL